MGDIVESFDGFKWYVEVPSDYLPLSDGEETVRRFLEMVASKDKVFVDVGCHVGSYTIRMAKLYREVVAIDPNPRSIQILYKNLELNGIKNVKVKNMGVGSRPGKMRLYCRGGSSTFHSMPGIKRVVNATVMPLDDLIDEADVIKIDVEGWEEEVLKGAKRIVSECRPVIVIEHHEYREYKHLKGMKARIIKMLNDYYHFDLNGVHTAYVPSDYDLEKIKEAIAWHWFNKAIKNLESGKPWYYGIPETWWHGGGVIDFLLALPRHVLKEEVWIERA